jgi:hypothetical protein
MMNNDRMMGLATPGDEKVSVFVRHWDGVRRQLWRSKVAWQIAVQEAASILEKCRHVETCPGKADEKVACVSACRDREMRMSALVILTAARQFAPLDAKRLAEGPYYAPSREHFSEVIADFMACQAELEELRKASQGGATTSTALSLVATLEAGPVSLLTEATASKTRALRAFMADFEEPKKKKTKKQKTTKKTKKKAGQKPKTRRAP